MQLRLSLARAPSRGEVLLKPLFLLRTVAAAKVVLPKTKGHSLLYDGYKRRAYS